MPERLVACDLRTFFACTRLGVREAPRRATTDYVNITTVIKSYSVAASKFSLVLEWPVISISIAR
jgi:hypothetical protein